MGDVVPLAGWRIGDDCVGDNGRVWPRRAPSGESGVLQRSFEETESKRKFCFAKFIVRY